MIVPPTCVLYVEGLPDPIMKRGSSTFGTRPVWVSDSMSKRLKRACVTRIVTSLTETTCARSVTLLGTSRCATPKASRVLHRSELFLA
jgi:hypothetical protein